MLERYLDAHLSHASRSSRYPVLERYRCREERSMSGSITQSRGPRRRAQHQPPAMTATLMRPSPTTFVSCALAVTMHVSAPDIGSSTPRVSGGRVR